jgi:SAM-dependent methyltransferase
MTKEFDLYDGHFGQLATDPQVEVRRETYGEDLGQASWITVEEARAWFDLLRLGRGRRALEVACGSGGVTCAMASDTGAECVGVDINVHGIEAAKQTSERQKLSSLASFQLVDAGHRLPFPDQSFDAVFCNDSINHLPNRSAVFEDWFRLLRPDGRVLFTDPIVVTGQLSNDEIRARSSIGFFIFTPLGHNEYLLAKTGFQVREVRDVTDSVASVSKKWRDARAKRRERLVALEGREGFEGLQRFLDAVYTLANERRLSRYMYLAQKPASPNRSLKS